MAIARHESRVAALRLAVVAQAEADAVGVDAGATSTAAWHADATGQTPAQAFRLSRQAQKLEQHDRVREALGAGEVRLDQAEVITDAVDALPADLVDQRVRDEARGRAAGLCDCRAPAERAVPAPGRGADPGGRRPRGRGRGAGAGSWRPRRSRAAEKTRLTMSDDGQGCVHGRFTLPSAVGAMLRKALQAIAAPKHQHATQGPDRRYLRDATGERQAPAPAAWARRSASTSPGTPPRTSPRPAGSTPPWWSPWTWRPCSARRRPPPWTPARR